MFEEDALWAELAQWRTSAAQYAEAVQLRGRASSVISPDAVVATYDTSIAYIYFLFPRW